ncbi:hypothetical protein M413DRAFT_437812 [Hebeloma cylindrosporum]|uniref:ABM domain-containing protein n=1 Tax=Hebeloma cylindrosporum TaxID=76867 RepID=A0A0C3CIW3_HEBCY|nr:hypothetical protein M413DRAFT_437812 [Hebeloma cylindrosporum h7]
MPVTEFVTLKFKEPFTINHPPIHQGFQTLFPQQAEWSGYPLTLYQNTQDERLFYLISGWDNVEAHNKWIASQANQDLFTYFEPFITIEDFAHVAIDFRQFPTEVEVLTCRKYSIDDQRRGLGADGGQVLNHGEIWAVEGRGEEKPTDIYRFAAREGFQSNIDPEDSGIIIMKRIHFDRGEV